MIIIYKILLTSEMTLAWFVKYDRITFKNNINAWFDLYKSRKNKILLWQIKVRLIFGKGLVDYVREWTNKSLLDAAAILFLVLGGG